MSTAVYVVLGWFAVAVVICAALLASKALAAVEEMETEMDYGWPQESGARRPLW